MPNTTVSELGKRMQLPTWDSSETFTVKGQTYEILRFSERKGSNLEQTIAIASMKHQEMLTIQEAREIRDNDESSTAFKNALKLGEWGYVRDAESEKRSLAAFLYHGRFVGWLDFVDDVSPDYASRVVILKKSGSEAAAPKNQSTLLRLEKGEVLEVTLPDGQKISMNATQATIRRE